MEYEEFKKGITDELSKYYGKDAVVTIEEILKNNGERKEAVLIRFSDEPEKTAPIIYLKPVYEEYERYGDDIQEYVGRIVELREKERGGEPLVEIIMEWEKAKNNIYPVLISKTDNMELLNRLLYSDFLDLAVIYEIRWTENNRVLSCKVTKEMLRVYKITKTELHSRAIENMKQDGYCLRDLLHEICDLELPDDKDSLCETGKIYILTNFSKKHGAAGLLYTELLKEKMNGMSAYIIPSSVHEILLVPIELDMETEKINDMIEQVNQEVVAKEKRLENHCYIWDGGEGRIKIPA